MAVPDHLTPERIAVLRQMTPQQRLQEATRMYWEARRAKADEIRNLHQNWSEQMVNAEVSRLFFIEAMKEG